MLDATVDSFAVAVAVGGSAFSATGAGSEVSNHIGIDVEAEITNFSVVESMTGDVQIHSVDLASIKGTSLAASIAAAAGAFAGAVSVGVALSFNQVQNDVIAEIDSSTVLLDGGDFELYAIERGNLSSDAEAAAIAAAFSIYGSSLSLSGGGSEAQIKSSGLTKASVAASTIDASDGKISLISSHDISHEGNAGASAVAASLNSLAAAGSIATIDIEPEIQSSIDALSTTEASQIEVMSRFHPFAQAAADGIAAGAGAVGVSHSKITAVPTVKSTTGGTVTADSLEVTATSFAASEKDYTLQATSVGGTGALLGTQSTLSETLIGGSVQAMILPNAVVHSGETSLNATSVATQKALADSFAGGVLCLGEANSEAISSTTVRTQVGEQSQIIGNDFAMTATRTHSTYADTYAGGASLLIAGSSALGDTSQTGDIEATIGPNASFTLKGAFQQTAASIAESNGWLETLAGAAFSGSGATLSNEIEANVTTNVGENTSVEAAEIDISARNTFNKIKDEQRNNIQGLTFGLVAGAKIESITNVTMNTNVHIPEAASLVVVGLETTDQLITISAQNKINATDNVSFEAYGALGSGTEANSRIISNINEANIHVADAAEITSVGSIAFTARTEGDITTSSNADAGALALTVILAESQSDLLAKNRVNFAENSRVTSDGDIIVTTGMTRDFEFDQFEIQATTDTIAYTLIPIEDIDSQAILNVQNKIEVANDSQLNSAGNIFLFASDAQAADMLSNARAVNWLSEIAEAFSTEQWGGTPSKLTVVGSIQVDGLLKTGTQRNRNLTFGSLSVDGAPSGWDAETGEPTVYQNEDQIEWRMESGLIESALFDDLAKAQESYLQYGSVDEDLALFYRQEIERIESELLANQLAFEEVVDDTRFIVPIRRTIPSIVVPPIRSQAGIVDIRGTGLFGTGSIESPGNASITIVNHTPTQLNLQGLHIPEVNGGLFFNGSQYETNGEIDDANGCVSNEYGEEGIGEDCAEAFQESPQFSSIVSGSGAAVPVITVQNTFEPFNYAEEDLTPPSLVVLAAEAQGTGIRNISGSVNLKNVAGNLIVNHSIAAKDTSLDATDGNLIYDSGSVSGSSYSVSGSPYSLLTTLGTGISSYNQASAIALLEAPTSDISINANAISINAEYVNINGIIQSGREAYSLTLENSYNDEIASVLNGGAHGVLARLSSPDPDFELYFDRLEHQIIVKPIRSSGGDIQIVGNIVSSGGGEIRVLDGYPTVSINNQTDYDIVLEKIDLSSAGRGRLKIIDKGIIQDGSPKVTQYGNEPGNSPTINGLYHPDSR
ncbi:hypothetical protein N9D23_14545, partial [Rubripirellula sp.]|nr:hypothetical protein [Rubripirellula sp.]